MKMKVYIPSYNRADAITTHNVFLERSDIFDVKVIVHNEEQAEKYRKNGVEVINSNTENGIANIRQWIWGQLEEGEWFISADDDLDKIFVNKESWAKQDSEFKYTHDNDFFFSKIPELIKEAEARNVKAIGFAIVHNEYFNTRKYKDFGHILNTLVIWKKDSVISWKTPLDINVREEMNITAQQHMYFGGVLRCGYISTNGKHYQEGGLGILKTRKPEKIKNSKILIDYYKGFFAHKNDDDVSCIIKTNELLRNWRLYMIKEGKLNAEYAYKILGNEAGQKFINKYCTL